MWEVHIAPSWTFERPMGHWPTLDIMELLKEKKPGGLAQKGPGPTTFCLLYLDRGRYSSTKERVAWWYGPASRYEWSRVRLPPMPIFAPLFGTSCLRVLGPTCQLDGPACQAGVSRMAGPAC